jgi:hypothetical protein
MTDELRGKSLIEVALEKARGDVGVEDYEAHPMLARRAA